MKSWKNRRNTYWIFLATVFGLIFPGNWTNGYINLVGLLLCWGLYLFCFIKNNHEVEEQEQKEQYEKQKRIEKRFQKEENDRKEKEKRNKQFCESTEYLKIIDCILIKYNRDWENDMYPSYARHYIISIKKQIEAEVSIQKNKIKNCQITISQLKKIKGMNKTGKEQKKINNQIKANLSNIDSYQKNIYNIPQKYALTIESYQNIIEKFKIQCKEKEKKFDILLNTNPKKIIEAVDYYMMKLESQKRSSINNKEKRFKRKEEIIPYLFQAKIDAINKIDTKQ